MCEISSDSGEVSVPASDQQPLAIVLSPSHCPVLSPIPPRIILGLIHSGTEVEFVGAFDLPVNRQIRAMDVWAGKTFRCFAGKLTSSERRETFFAQHASPLSLAPFALVPGVDHDQKGGSFLAAS